jgi:WD40 repeat protein
MLRSRLILAALAVGVLAAFGADAPPKGGDKAADSPPALRDLAGIQRLAYAPDGKSLLIHYTIPPNPGGASKMGIWDVETGKFRVALQNPPPHCEQVAFSPDGSKAAVIAAGDKRLTVWDAAAGKVAEEFTLPAWEQFMPIAPFVGFSPDGSSLTSVYKNKILRAKLGGEAKLVADAPERWSRDLTAYAPGADLLVFGSNPPIGQKGSKLVAFDMSKPDEPQTIPVSGWVRSIAITPDGKTLAVAYEREINGAKATPGKVELWDAQAWKVQSTLPADKREDFISYGRLAISPDGKTLAGAPGFNRGQRVGMELLDAEGKVLRDLPPWRLTAEAAFSPDGKTAVVVLDSKPPMFLDTATGKDKEP